jgi:cation diffusion facilitator CzcD-associated flavoprotein CzcO
VVEDHIAATGNVDGALTPIAIDALAETQVAHDDIAAAAEGKRAGLDVTLLEKTNDLGGVWRKEGLAQGMSVNISLNTGVFSDTPLPEGTLNYPTAKEMHHYLLRYAETNKLNENIKLNCCVTNVCKKNGKWKVTYLENQQEHTRIFDHVVVASGKFVTPKFPEKIEKIEPGKILHSAQYKSAADLAQSKITVVIGNGNSA